MIGNVSVKNACGNIAVVIVVMMLSIRVAVLGVIGYVLVYLSMDADHRHNLQLKSSVGR